MNRYTVTYLQECTQPVQAPTIEAAGEYAKNYAASRNLRVLQVYPAGVSPVAPPPAA
jgi:hypothetical protein